MAEAGRWMRSELERAYQSWQAGGHRQRPARTSQTARRGADDPLAAWHEAMAGLHSRPDVAAESRIPLAPVMRRAVLRAIDHYDAHQRQTLGALAGGIDDLLTQILGRLTALESAAAATPVPIPDPVSLSQHQALREQVDDVRRIVTKSETRLDDVEADTARLDDKLAASERLLPEAVDGLGARLDEQARVTSERLGERDRRIDSTDLEVHRVRREVEVLHQIAALRHVPVPAGAEVVICDAGTLLVPHDKIILPALRAERCWEPVEAALLAELAGAGTVLDVGAHVGYHTLRLLLQCPGVERVIAVEAHPVNADLLRRNVIVNLPAKGADKVLVLPVAAWDRAATLRLFHGEAGNSGDYRVRADADPAGMIEVPAIRLDEHPEVRAGRVTLIKTDLQGRDHRAIAGLHGVLTAHRPHVVCEFWPAAITELGDDPIAVLGGYRSLGYRPVPVGADGRPARLTDAELVDKAGTAEGGFLSLWLQP
jgi:FkbM family methyltransferase